MLWKKLGRIYNPEIYKNKWRKSHAAVPTAIDFGDGDFRVYYSPRDANNHSYVDWFELNLDNPYRLLSVSKKPILRPGRLGNFDDSGTMVSWIVNLEKQIRMYYIGWNSSLRVPYRNSIGLAISRDGGETFNRFSEGPLLDRSMHDPTMTASSCVIKEKDIWRMWYLSGLAWSNKKGVLIPRYNIKYAESSDGISWKREGIVCIDFKDESEYAISRPCVLKEGGIYRMWYSYRGSYYRIGYAESSDGISWKRKDDKVGISVSRNGWDSEMIEYPFVVKHKKKKYMFYNGNNYGKTGIGLAILVE